MSEVLGGLVSAVAFATILAVVYGPLTNASGTIVRDLLPRRYSNSHQQVVPVLSPGHRA